MAGTNKVREELAQRFLAALNEGYLPWNSCWNQDKPLNAVSGIRYRGVNSIWLSFVAEFKGYSDPRWCTYKQAEAKGWHIQKGEKATYVEYWAYFDRQQKKLLPWKEANELLKDKEYAEKNLVLTSKVFAVFNAKQIDGIPEYNKNHIDIGDIRAQRDTLITNMGISYREQGQQAYYSPSDDRVTLPPESTFDNPYGYMATFLHECGHATGHASRLNRPLDGYYQNPESYAKEELRAEIASAFTVQELGLRLTPEEMEFETKRHMGYVQAWAQHIKEAPEALFQAIKDAEKISDYLIEKGEFQPLLDRQQHMEVLEQIPDNSYAVLQLSPDNHFEQLKFMELAYWQKRGMQPKMEMYHKVYDASLPEFKPNPTEFLESLYAKFNAPKLPEDYFGHSMSISDVVAIRENGTTSYHFVDSIGFRELPDFDSRQQEKRLKQKPKAAPEERDSGSPDGATDRIQALMSRALADKPKENDTRGRETPELER